jgi:hypothetical protein
LILGRKKDIQRLQQDIRGLDSIVAAEAAEEAWKNSWASWLLSPIYKRAVDSDEEKSHKDRMRQERKLEKDMKERRLGWKKVELSKEESLLRLGQAEVDAVNLADDRRILVIQTMLRARELREREERERQEREKREREWKEQQERWKQMREAAEAMRRKQDEERAAEEAKMWQKIIDDIDEDARANCRHDGWWPKVQGRTRCPKCSGRWKYLLQCPGCEMKACPKCQSDIRLNNRRRRNSRVGANHMHGNDGDDSEYTCYY